MDLEEEEYKGPGLEQLEVCGVLAGPHLTNFLINFPNHYFGKRRQVLT